MTGEREPGAPNRGVTYRERVDRRGSGIAVLAYLVRSWPHSDGPAWRERIAEGRVQVDGVAVGPDRILRGGDVLTWHRPPWVEPEAPAGLEIVHADPDLVVVSKPPGLPTLPGGGFLENTLQHRVRERFPDARPMHRLGRFTSGLVLFGRSVAMQRHLAAAFREGAIHKRYRALLAGTPVRDRFTVDAPIGPVPHAVLGTVHAAAPEGRPSSSAFRVVERRATDTVADVVIATGRPHQIRIHAAAAGHPLAGDPLYAAGGRPPEGCRALPGDPGYLLHAAELRFPGLDGSPRAYDDPPPAPLRSVRERPGS